MKTLLLVRHAKSSWANEGQDDFDRPLNDRGKSDAPQMAKRILAKIPDPDLFISSPAKRALKTARLFAEVFDRVKMPISLHDALYLASAATIYQTIALLPDDRDKVFLFAHNPGITEAANMLSGVRIDNMPTCGVFAVAADVDNWKAFGGAEKKFLFFDYPKNPLH
jgi:phosphohistidine phosphatase